ncbi:nitrite transporter [Escherichia coli]|nr:nitrite transporter [Escherichia coli]EGA3984862.1 nitrite transporter [Escherichia coli]HBA7660643.1 nitrite transporter [Escherichia coli]
MTDTSRLLTARYTPRGRQFPRVDCWGYVLEVRRQLGFPPLPELAGVFRDEADTAARRVMPQLTECEAQEGALALCFVSGLLTHVGIVVTLNAQLYVTDCRPRCHAVFTPLRQFRELNNNLRFMR